MDTTNLPDPTTVTTWPQALVVITIVLAVSVLPGVMAYLNNRLAKQAQQTVEQVKTTLTQNNGGSSVKDALDRIEATLTAQGNELRAQGDRLDEHLEEAARRDERINALEKKPRRRTTKA